MRDLLLKILAFLLGIKHKTTAEHVIAGRKLTVQAIMKCVQPQLAENDIQDIWLLGAIEYSEDKLSYIKGLLTAGGEFQFSPPANFDFKGNYIDFYQLSTKDNRYFILALSNTFALHKENSKMMFVAIERSYPTNKLEQSWNYYKAPV